MICSSDGAWHKQGEPSYLSAPQPVKKPTTSSFSAQLRVSLIRLAKEPAWRLIWPTTVPAGDHQRCLALLCYWQLWKHRRNSVVFRFEQASLPRLLAWPPLTIKKKSIIWAFFLCRYWNHQHRRISAMRTKTQKRCYSDPSPSMLMPKISFTQS